MSEHRRTGIDACPIDERPVTMDKCQPCRFFRGAANFPQTPAREWSVTCNWPRDGAYIAPTEPIPAAFLKAFGDEG